MAATASYSCTVGCGFPSSRPGPAPNFSSINLLRGATPSFSPPEPTMSLLNPVDTHGNMIHISTGVVLGLSQKDHQMCQDRRDHKCQSSFHTLFSLLSTSLTLLLTMLLGWSLMVHVRLQLLSPFLVFSLVFCRWWSSVWGWSPMGDDSSRWVSRTRRWQSPRLHQSLLRSIWGDCWETLLIGTLRPPDSDGWASKWGEMGLLTSQLFCNVDPTLPSTLFFWDMVYWLKRCRYGIGGVDTQYTAVENTMGRPKCRGFDIIYSCGTAVAELWDLWLPRWRLECWGHHCHWWEEGSRGDGNLARVKKKKSWYNQW